MRNVDVIPIQYFTSCLCITSPVTKKVALAATSLSTWQERLHLCLNRIIPNKHVHQMFYVYFGAPYTPFKKRMQALLITARKPLFTLVIAKDFFLLWGRRRRIPHSKLVPRE